MVRVRRQERLHVPKLDEEPGHPGPRVRRPADHRHLQHLVGADALQRAFPQDRRAREARRVRRPAASRWSSRCSPTASRTCGPTAMLTRNLASMDVEEAIRGNPIDAVVLLTGCDKTTPALLMGAASCDIPAIVVTGGPMLNGKLEGRDIGSGTAVWQLHEAMKAGEIDVHQFLSAEAGMSRSAGTCNTMGTASTMACMAEALGTSLPHNAAIPGGRRAPLRAGADVGHAHRRDGARRPDALEDPHARGIRERDPHQCRDRRLDQCVIHLKAIAGRMGVELELEDLDAHRPRHPDAGRPDALGPLPDGGFLLRRRPAGRAAPSSASGLPHLDALTANGQTAVGKRARRARATTTEVIRPLARPAGSKDGGIASCAATWRRAARCIKPSAASPRAAQAPRPRRGVREPRGLQGASTTRTWTSTRAPCWC
jgi:L-arabonate dehydrase